MNDHIDRLARAFADAAHELAEALLLAHPEVVPSVEAALHAGAKVLLAMQIDVTEPAIKLATVDDYERMTCLATIPGKAPVRQ